MERVGNITFDDKYYPGRDMYCDGIIEDELLKLVQQNKPEQFPRVIEEAEDWSVLYHLSPFRENIVGWIPLDPSMKVLEVGSGCGAITGALARKAGEVTCLELSRKRSLINAHRHQKYHNITVKLGNFQDIEPELPADYDYIFLIGVFEYGQNYIAGDTPYEDWLAILKKHIKPDGRIVIAIENRLGLKYWAGCKEDHFGNYFSGIEGYPSDQGVRTFSQNALEQMLQKSSNTSYTFYYPYPDYKFMTSIYSDAYLPKIGELSNNYRNFDRDRMLLFDEKNAFDSLIRDGLFATFSNSYLVVIGPRIPVVYAKFSNDRAEQYVIRTDMVQDENGMLHVEKRPLSAASKLHIESIKTSFRLLSARYEGSRLDVNQCEEKEGVLHFPYIQGKTLEEILDGCLERNDTDGFLAWVKEYESRISYNPKQIAVTDYDLIFSNILVEGDDSIQTGGTREFGDWSIIDYEWTVAELIPDREILYRALYCYMLGAEKRRKLKQELIFERLGFAETEITQLEEKERVFQAKATGERLPMGAIRNRIGNEIFPIQQWEADYIARRNRNAVQIYEDYGQGFSEENSVILRKCYVTPTQISLEYKMKGPRRAVRIDPCSEPCQVQVEEISWNGMNLSFGWKNVLRHGKMVGKNTVLFQTNDPNIVFPVSRLEQREENVLRVKMHITKSAMPTKPAGGS